MYDQPKQDSSLLIDTPENLALEAEIAGYGSRFIAAFIDYTIILTFLGILTVAVWYAYLGSDVDVVGTWAAAAYGFIVFLLVLFYHLIFEFFWNGQTPGKRRVGLRVVMNNGLPVTTSAAVTRNLVRLFDFLPLFYGVGLISMFFTRQVQRLGDFAAGTVVVKERAGLSLQSLREDFTVAYLHITRTSQLDDRLVIDRLTPQDRRVLVSYLKRREHLNDEQRQRMSIGLARKLAYLMGIAEPAATADLFHGVRSAETFLEQTARAFEVTERADEQRQGEPPSTSYS